MEAPWKPPIKMALTLLCGAVFGLAMMQGLRAQNEKKPAYIIAEVDVTDPQAFAAYAAKVPATLAPYHGRYIVRGKAEGKEGEPPHGVIVVLAFDSLAEATQWYSSPPYKELIPEREKAARSRVYIVEGLPQ
jgi:uncharacterized protein (DUF1330 family)